MTTPARRRSSVIAAHQRLLDAEIDLLERAQIAVPSNRWEASVLGLGRRAIQLQRTVHDGAVLGYSEELEPVARAMLSAMVTLAYIGRGRGASEREARVLAWLVDQRRSRLRLHDYLWRARRVKKAALEANAALQDAAGRAMLAEAAARGVVPAPKVGKWPTWTGLNEYELFRRTGYLRFYRDYYALWSDDSHAGPTSLNSAVLKTRRGQLDIGPTGASPWWVLYATARFGINIVAHVNKIYGLRRDKEILALWQRSESEFSACVPPTP
ncbi:MAG: DUF5677 domain-containing protein [Actinomycetota bacterium]|nr:DUF5677 domain-containing protein [Actinomycetota bacterium]